MDAVTATFLLVGAVGVVLLLVAVVLGDLGGHVGHPDADADSIFSLPAITAFLGGAGFVGAIPASLLSDMNLAGRLVLSALIGVAAAIPLAYGVIRLSAGLARMRTDPTLVDADLLGAQGTVITAVTSDHYGEVRLTVHGQPLKYYAKSAHSLPVGTPVYVIGTPSATSVEVVSTAYEPPTEEK